jgi:L-ascorbate metabolism protein UlaG (beta-lactamase superfamily)
MEMKIRRKILAIVILALPILPLWPAKIHKTVKKGDSNREPLELTQIANSGVMLAAGKSKVLIDALFDKPHPDYKSPAPETLEKIMAGTAPFDGVDLVLVTHNHSDHFAAPLVVRYLEAFPGATLMAPADAVAEMRKEAGWTKIAPHVVSFDLKVNSKKKRDLPGFSLTAFRTLHSNKQETPMNLMYMLQFDGWSIFHEGDSEATIDEYRGFGLGGAPIDLALVHFWFPLAPETAKLLQEVLKPAHVGLTHLPIRLENDAPVKINMVRQYYQDIFLLLPGMKVRTFLEGK